MKYTENELLLLKRTLESYKDLIVNTKITKLNSTFNKFYSSFYQLFSTLVTEKIITLDPYGEEYNLVTLDLPDSKPISNNEENYSISIRLTHFNSLLTFIKTNNILSINNMNPIKIEKLKKIFKFLDWNRVFDPQPEEVNTEALNKVLFYYQKEVGQKIIINSLKATTAEIDRYANESLSELEGIKLFYCETYKLWIREEILPELKLPPILQGTNIKVAHDQISEKIKSKDNPLFIELVGEVLNEDFSQSGDEIKKSILQKLNGSKPQKRVNNKEKIVSPAELLKSSFSELNKATTQIDSLVEKIIENSKTFREETYSLFEKLLDYINYKILGNKRKTIFKIVTEESSENKIVTKELDFERFISKIWSFKKLLINSYEQLSLTSNENINLDEIEKELSSLLASSKYIFKILNSLDQFFKKNLTLSKGIQIELKVLLSTIDKSQSIYFEYKKQNSDGLENSTYKPDINLTT